MPLRRVAESVEADIEHEAWNDLLSAWRSRVSCLSAEVIHVTADIRLSSIVEKIRCHSPIDANDSAAAAAAAGLTSLCVDRLYRRPDGP